MQGLGLLREMEDGSYTIQEAYKVRLERPQCCIQLIKDVMYLILTLYA